MEHIIREAIKMRLHPDNTNREEVFYLSKSQKDLLSKEVTYT
jgi:hypothetical protein